MLFFDPEYYVKSEIDTIARAYDLLPKDPSEETQAKTIEIIKDLEARGYKFPVLKDNGDVLLPLGSVIFASDYSFVVTSLEDDDKAEDTAPPIDSTDDDSDNTTPSDDFGASESILDNDVEVKVFYLGQPEDSTFVHIVGPVPSGPPTTTNLNHDGTRDAIEQTRKDEELIGKLYLDPEETKAIVARASHEDRNLEEFLDDLVHDILDNYLELAQNEQNAQKEQ